MCKSVDNHPYRPALRELEVGGRQYKYFSLKQLNDSRVEGLPFCVRVLLEAVVRNCDGCDVTPLMVEHVLDWQAQHVHGPEITFKPARVIFQDFTGLPALADFAALRQAVGRLGGNPSKVHPLCPVDLVIDHSVSSDFSRSPEAVAKNQETEFQRNRERFAFLKWGGQAFNNMLVVPPGAGICHQVNLEHLARVVVDHEGLLYPDSLVGADSHTTLINSLGVAAWGRSPERIAVIEAYLQAQGLLRDPSGCRGKCVYSEIVQLDVSTVVPSVSGPKRPQDRVPVHELKADFTQSLSAKVGFKGYGLPAEHLGATATITYEGQSYVLGHGSVVIAAITGCTNTSNPSVMLGAGLLAKKAVARGLTVAPYIRTSLSPGSPVAGCYLQESGTVPALEALGFHITGYGCMACAGNTEPLPDPVSKAIEEHGLVACGVLSGNRNWEGRVHASTRATYLASPLLVIACALAGTVNIDFEAEPIGYDTNGVGVYLRHIWPSREELQEVERRSVLQSMYQDVYRNVEHGNEAWNSVEVPKQALYSWDKASTFIRCPPFLDNVTCEMPRPEIRGAHILLWLGDGVSTDVISPAGSISRTSPAARYLLSFGLAPKDLNSYGARRGNHSVMARGTFSNPKLENKLAPKKGPYAVHQPTGKVGSVYDVAATYCATATPLVIVAGKDYGMGSSRDWAAKGPWLLGVRAVLAESFDCGHRRSLVGMGIWPLRFAAGQSAASVGLTGSDTLDMYLPPNARPNMDIAVKCGERTFTAVLCVDTELELLYLRHGGLLPMVLRRMVNCCARW